MRILSTSVIVVSALAATLMAGQKKPGGVPVEYTATINIVGPMGAAATALTMHIDAYTKESDRTSLLSTLRSNGYQAFLPAFRKEPLAGYVRIKDQKWDLRWAQRQATDKGEVVTAATDQPIYFVGGG